MKDKICMICKTAIDMDKEYCEFKHYERIDVIHSKAYYHVNCFRERLNSTGEQKVVTKEALSFIKGAKKLMGIKDEEVIVV
jgi:hypothetical protein